jgi:hypothetical protein
LGNKYGTGDTNPGTFPALDSGAINDLYGGEFQEFSLGLDYRIPVGLRRELSNVRNAQVKLARDIAYLEDQELDVTREISEAIRALDANRLLMQKSFDRWKDTVIEEEHFAKIVELGLETLDVALDAQRRKTQASAAFYSALAEYNKVIALVHRRKGTILAYSGVCFAEGPWPGKAYDDAYEHARRRGASRPINYGWTRPQVISQGPIYPTVGAAEQSVPVDGIPIDSMGTEYHEQGAPIYGQPYEVQSPDSNDVLPPPQNNGSSSRNVQPFPDYSQTSRRVDGFIAVVPSFVQQVNHEVPIKRQPNQVVDQHNVSTMKALPQRDSATATQPMPRQSKAVESAASITESRVNPTASKRNAPSIDWEKFGLTRPVNGSNPTEASIKNP